MAYRESQTLYLQAFFAFTEFVPLHILPYRFTALFFVISWVSDGFVGFRSESSRRALSGTIT